MTRMILKLKRKKLKLNKKLPQNLLHLKKDKRVNKIHSQKVKRVKLKRKDSQSQCRI